MSNAIPLLEQFGIPLPKTMSEYNLIGLDFGDGEISAAFVDWNAASNRHSVKGLHFDGTGFLYKTSNAFIHGGGVSRLLTTVESGAADPQGSVRYYNFKKCPGTADAKSKYLMDDRKTMAGLTYEQVMAEGFNVVINTILKNDIGHNIDPDKPTIILVGCPSSAGWEKAKFEYARLLKSRLKLPKDYRQEVYIAVHKESNAALARETDPQLGANIVRRGDVVVILDNGSSTFDITVVGKNGIPVGGEDSYQFGGNLLDEALLQMFNKYLAEKYPQMRPASKNGHKLGLRMAKERYYGLKGKDQQPTLYRVQLSATDGATPPANNTCKFLIDDDSMAKALGSIPVTARHFGLAVGGVVQQTPKKYKSWIDACRSIYTSFYEEMQQFFAKKNAEGRPVPDRIILSGGVSVMPEVQQVVQEVFGVAPSVTEHANYSVSEGLAYVLATEVRKGQYLREIEAQLSDSLPDIGSLRESLVSAGVDWIWDVYVRSLKKWSEQCEPLSIKDWHDKYFDEIFPYYQLDELVQQGAQQWYSKRKIESAITDMLKNKFDMMFPGYVEAFSYTFQKPSFDALNGIVVTITTSFAFLFGKLTANEDDSAILSDQSMEAPRDQQWRKQAYNNVLAMKDKICSGGSIDCTYTYTAMGGGFLGFGQHPVSKQGSTSVKYDGLAAMFRSELTDDVVAGIRSEIIELLKPELKNHVESITPYFNMTAQQ